MEQNKVIKYDKLIRDRIPEIIEKHGNKAIVEVLDKQNFPKYLKLKLAEELQEYLASDNVEELADLVEVVYALLDCAGVSRAEFEAIRKAKLEDRGGFKEKLLLKEVIRK